MRDPWGAGGIESSDPSADLRLSTRLVDNCDALLYPLPIMRHVKHPPQGLALGILILLVFAMCMLSAACGDETELAEGVLCFTPDGTLVGILQPVQLTVTVRMSGGGDGRNLDEESGWRWVQSSEDGGEVEFSQVELQWSAASEGYYLAGVSCTAVKAGTVTVSLGQPNDRFPLLLVGNEICEPTCTITISTVPLIW